MTGYCDVGTVDELTAGADMTGETSSSNETCPEQLKLATVNEGQFIAQASRRREAALAKRRTQNKEEAHKVIWEHCMQEE